MLNGSLYLTMQKMEEYDPLSNYYEKIYLVRE